MLSALFYLQTRSLWNGLLTRLRRLRQPKYLLGGIVGLAWFAWTFGSPFFFRSLNSARGRGGAAPRAAFGFGEEFLTMAEGLGACALALWVVFSWILPSSRAALQFSEAEISFLFPAPFSRRRLIHYKLLRWQVGLLVTSLVFTFFTGRFARDGAWLFHVLGWWIVLFTLNLHGLAASFTVTRMMDSGLWSPRRRWWVIGALGVVVAAGFLLAQRFFPELSAAEDLPAKVRGVLDSPAGYWLLWPFRLVLRPALSDTAAEFLGAILPALAVLAVQYLWVIWAEVSFEEASIALSQKRAEMIASARTGNWQAHATSRKPRSAPFVLHADGFPPLAILWKNLISAGAVFSGRTGFFLVAWLVVMGVSFGSTQSQGFAGILVAVAGMALVLLTMMGSQIFRNDFRQDFNSIDWLRQFPLPGWQIALGELLAPALMLTVIQWLLVLFLLALSVTTDLRTPWDMAQRVSLAACIALLAPAYNLVTLLVPNLATVVFPAWFQSGREGPGGLEVMGQRLLFTFGTLLAVVISLVPAGVAFGVVWFVLQLVVSPWLAAPFGSLAGALVLLAEASLGIAWLGRLFDKIDITGA